MRILHRWSLGKCVAVQEADDERLVVWLVAPLSAQLVVGEHAALPTQSDELVLVLDVPVDALDDANRRDNRLVVAARAVEHDYVPALKIAEVRPRHVHLLDRIAVRLRVFEVGGLLCFEDRVRQQVRVVLRINRYKEHARLPADIRKRELWIREFGGGLEPSNVHPFVAILVLLDSMPDEAELFEQADQALLFHRPVEDRHVDLIRSLPQRVVENDFQETFAQLVSVQFDLEGSDLQPSGWGKGGLNVGVVLVRSLDLHIEECYEAVLVEAAIGGLVTLLVEPRVEGVAAIVGAKTVEERLVDRDLTEEELANGEDLVVSKRWILSIDLFEECLDREHAVADSEPLRLASQAAIFCNEKVNPVAENLVEEKRVDPAVIVGISIENRLYLRADRRQRLSVRCTRPTWLQTPTGLSDPDASRFPFDFRGGRTFRSGACRAN